MEKSKWHCPYCNKKNYPIECPIIIAQKVDFDKIKYFEKVEFICKDCQTEWIERNDIRL